MKCKIRICQPLPLADFSLDNATNRVPGFFASNSYFPGE